LEKCTTEDEEDGLGMRNLAAAALLVALIAAGGWLIDHLCESARIEMCREAGHPHWAPLNPTVGGEPRTG
jgi:hypothetical protein